MKGLLKRIETVEKRLKPPEHVRFTLRFAGDDDPSGDDAIRLKWPEEVGAEFGKVRPKNNGT